MSRAVWFGVAALVVAGLGPGRAAEPAGPPGLPASAFPKPDRPVAEIISPQWATERERDAVDEAGQVARLLGVGPGSRVADIGAGSGYYAVRLARIVGREGRVFAQDVVPDYLARLEVRIRREAPDAVTVVAGEPHDPRLPADSVDVAILVHMYHEIEQPFGLLHNLVPAFRTGGRLGIVDLDRRPENHGTPRALLRCELVAAGYREVAFHQLQNDPAYLAVFAPPSAGARPDPATIRPCAMERRR